MKSASTAFSTILPRISEAKEEIGESPHRIVQFSEPFFTHGQQWRIGAIVGRFTDDIYLQIGDFGVLFRWYADDLAGAEKNLSRAMTMVESGEALSLMLALEDAEQKIETALTMIRHAGIHIEDTRD